MIGKFNVLVVDDDPDKRQLLAVALRMEGYDVTTADDGMAGLEAVESHQPDLIVSDVMMPRMDGYEMAERLRSNPQTRFIPIIIQTAAKHAAQDARRGAAVGALGYFTDPTDLDLLLGRARTLLEFKDYLDSWEAAAFTDHLTGLSNRRHFERQLEREITRSSRYGHPFCLLLIDIDNFKLVNDTHGHEAGDEAIRLLAKVLQAGTRGIDTVARVGGEEFAALLTETDFKSGFEVAERLRVTISEMRIPVVGKITASFGVAEFPSCTAAGSDLYSLADATLYEAKRGGRNRVEGAQKPENQQVTLDVS